MRALVIRRDKLVGRAASRTKEILAAVMIVLMSSPVAVQSAPAPPLRCGWLENPTPGNVWLTDRGGEWTIGTQGGHQAEGDWPQFVARRWVKTNGHYGYGCACLRFKADATTRQVLSIISAQSRSLAACRNDKRLKEPLTN